MKRLITVCLAVVLTLAVLWIPLSLIERHVKKTSPHAEPAPFEEQYKPFDRHILHPIYLFFFPQNPPGNEVCSIDRRGFRGAVPEDAHGKKLAFIVGGSAVFGHGCSSNDTTISGYLNQLQKEYLVVNTGVPSWSSTQEVERIAFELLDYKPALIIVYDGYNDMNLDYWYAGRYPPGTPESYFHLEQAFKDLDAITHPVFSFKLSNIKYWNPFPATRLAFANWRTAHKAQAADNESKDLEFSRESADKSAEAYIRNLLLIKDLCAARHIKLINIYQPLFYTHKDAPHLTGRWFKATPKQIAHLHYFHEQVMRQAREKNIDLIDYSNIFDLKGSTAPPLSVFIDRVHLTDQGNKMVAERIKDMLRGN